MNNRKTSGYDEIKGMLKTMRSLNETVYTNKKLIKEEEETQQPTDNTQNTDNNLDKKQYDNVEVVNDVDVKLLSTEQEETKLKPEEKTGISQIIDSFRQQVSQIASLEPGITITESEIRLDGEITDLEINFVIIAGEGSGLYINGDMLLLDDETMEMLEKLRKFEPTFTSAMEPLIRDRMNA